MKKTTKFAVASALLALATPALAEAPNCDKVAAVVTKSLAGHPDKVLELVANQVTQNESCACEVVKAAIVGSDADKELVAEIVIAAIEAAPEKIRIIGQCAVAVAPDALAEVQSVIAEYGAASGDSGTVDAKGGDEKGAKLAKGVIPPIPPNPLDFPGEGIVGPSPLSPGGDPLLTIQDRIVPGLTAVSQP